MNGCCTCCLIQKRAQHTRTHTHTQNFRQYLTDLEEGVFIQVTLTGLVLDADGKQLMIEVWRRVHYAARVCTLTHTTHAHTHTRTHAHTHISSIPHTFQALYLLGVMLLLLDSRVPGSARERMLVAHLRYMVCLSVCVSVCVCVCVCVCQCLFYVQKTTARLGLTYTIVV